MRRVTNHPVLVKDPYVCEFLEIEGELPRFAGAPVLSGATAKRILKNVGEAVGKWTYKMDETDEVILNQICLLPLFFGIFI